VNSQKPLTIAWSALALALSCTAAIPVAFAQQAAAGGASDSAFQSMDQNHDGHLTRAEIPKDMVLLRTRFTTYDRNQDNALDAQEFAAAQVAMKGSGNAMGGGTMASPERHSHP
jgi:hypothetical protein